MKGLPEDLHAMNEAATLDVSCLANLYARPAAYLWPGRIPRRGITLVGGPRRVGKRLFVHELIARVTYGKRNASASRTPSSAPQFRDRIFRPIDGLYVVKAVRRSCSHLRPAQRGHSNPTCNPPIILMVARTLLRYSSAYAWRVAVWW